MSMKTCITLMLLLLSALFILPSGGNAGNEKINPLVSYDESRDIIDVTAKNVSLKGLLARISLMSGVEILMDPNAEKKISIAIKGASLEAGLKRIVRGLSSAMIYEEDEKKGKVLLVAMRVFKKNGPNKAKLISVATLENEIAIHSAPPRKDERGGSDREVPSIMNFASQRWQVRLEKLSEEKREQILEKIKDRQDKRKAQRATREKIREKMEKRRAGREAERSKRDEELKKRNPERYDLMMKRRQEIREQSEITR